MKSIEPSLSLVAAVALATLAVAHDSRAGCPGACSVPGGGSPTTDCIAELDGPTANSPAKKPKKIVCTEGDPSCDVDGAANGVCRFRLRACFNNGDPRIPQCAATDVAGFEVKNREPGHKKFLPGLAALQSEADALLPATDATCTGLQTVDVPLKAKSGGELRKGRAKVGTRAETSAGVRDNDRVKMFCLPGEAVAATGPPDCARATVVTSPSELIGGPMARGRLGDALMENDRVRVIVQKPGRVFFSIGTYGGNIIDADVQREPGDPDRDNFEELIPGINIESTARYADMTIVNDGSDCQPAVLRFIGVDDIFDFVNGSSAINDMGFTFPASADDVDIPVSIQTDYTLETGSNFVRIDTTITNEEPSPLQIYFVEYINGSGHAEMWRSAYGFGEPLATTTCPPSTYVPCSAGSCDLCNVIAFGGEDEGDGVSYGYVHTENGTSAVTVSGVTVPALGQEVAAVFLGADNPNFSMAPAGAPGDAVTITRYFVVGAGSIGEVVSARNEIQGITTGRLLGTITAGGQPVAGAEVVVLGTPYAGGPSDNVVSHYRTLSDGSYGGSLPVGTYTVRANKDGRLFGSPDPATNLAITPGGTTVQDFTLPEPARLRVLVTDENGDPSPAKIQLVGFDPSPDPLNTQNVAGAIENTTGQFGDRTTDGLPFGIALSAFAGADGDTGEIEAEPGSYQLAVSRGPRYSLATQSVTLTAGSLSTVALQLARVVDTPGFVGCDFHVHSIDSPDSMVAKRTRVASMLAEGMDFFASTDHGFRSDFGPTIDEMGVADLIATTPSAEITTFDYGHFNAWPAGVDFSQLHGGGVDWGRAETVPGTDYPSLGAYSLSPAELIAAAHDDTPGNVVQINHMESHFRVVGLDIDTAEGGTGPPQSHVDPAVRRLDPGLSNLFSSDFDALEVWIGTNGRSGGVDDFLGENLGDWFNLTNQGILRAGIADSDTHSRRNTQVNARSYVASAVTDPAVLGGQALAIAANVRGGRLTGTNGPFMEVTVSAASTGQTAGHALGLPATVATTDGAVDVDVSVTSPEWAEFDSIQFFVNNAPQPYDHDGDTGTRDRYRVIPDHEHVAGLDFTVATVNDFPSIPGASHFEGSTTLSLSGLSADAWVVVVVQGTDGVSRPLFPVVPNDLDDSSNATLGDLTDGNLGELGVTALAFSNPLYIDVGGDGWTAPGVMLTPP